MPSVEVIFYETRSGVCPAQEFLDSLDTKMWAKMARAVNMLACNGNRLREPYSKPLGDGIFELRAQAEGDISRVLYFFFVGNKAILTNGFIKKTHKTPSSEIDRAKRYSSDFLERSENNEKI